MIKEIKNHDDLTTFYFGYEFEIDMDWINTNNPVYSIAEVEDNQIVSACTVSYRLGHYILDYIAVKVCKFKKGYGTKLINNVLSWAKQNEIKEIYLIAKEPKFFEKTGAIYIDDEIGYLNECKKCEYYDVYCSPKAMKYEVL